MKKSYAEISYDNCGSIDYDYTICEWDLVGDNLLAAQDDLEGSTENGDTLPSVTIKPVFMTDEEYEKWFIENVESNA